MQDYKHIQLGNYARGQRLAAFLCEVGAFVLALLVTIALGYAMGCWAPV